MGDRDGGVNTDNDTSDTLQYDGSVSNRDDESVYFFNSSGEESNEPYVILKREKAKLLAAHDNKASGDKSDSNPQDSPRRSQATNSSSYSLLDKLDGALENYLPSNRVSEEMARDPKAEKTSKPRREYTRRNALRQTDGNHLPETRQHIKFDLEPTRISIVSREARPDLENMDRRGYTQQVDKDNLSRRAEVISTRERIEHDQGVKTFAPKSPLLPHTLKGSSQASMDKYREVKLNPSDRSRRSMDDTGHHTFFYDPPLSQSDPKLSKMLKELAQDGKDLASDFNDTHSPQICKKGKAVVASPAPVVNLITPSPEPKVMNPLSRQLNPSKDKSHEIKNTTPKKKKHTESNAASRSVIAPLSSGSQAPKLSSPQWNSPQKQTKDFGEENKSSIGAMVLCSDRGLTNADSQQVSDIHNNNVPKGSRIQKPRILAPPMILQTDKEKKLAQRKARRVLKSALVDAISNDASIAKAQIYAIVKGRFQRLRSERDLLEKVSQLSESNLLPLSGKLTSTNSGHDQPMLWLKDDTLAKLNPQISVAIEGLVSAAVLHPSFPRPEPENMKQNLRAQIGDWLHRQVGSTINISQHSAPAAPVSQTRKSANAIPDTSMPRKKPGRKPKPGALTSDAEVIVGTTPAPGAINNTVNLTKAQKKEALNAERDEAKKRADETEEAAYLAHVSPRPTRPTSNPISLHRERKSENVPKAKNTHVRNPAVVKFYRKRFEELNESLEGNDLAEEQGSSVAHAALAFVDSMINGAKTKPQKKSRAEKQKEARSEIERREVERKQAQAVDDFGLALPDDDQEPEAISDGVANSDLDKKQIESRLTTDSHEDDDFSAWYRESGFEDVVQASQGEDVAEPTGIAKISQFTDGRDLSVSTDITKKRKRAVSDVSSSGSQADLADDMHDEASPEPSKQRKHKKLKKLKPTTKVEKSKQSKSNTGYGDLSYREVQNLVKLQEGKTISKKRKRREEQQTEAHGQADSHPAEEDASVRPPEKPKTTAKGQKAPRQQSTSSIEEHVTPVRDSSHITSKEEALRQTVTRGRPHANIPEVFIKTPVRFRSPSPPSSSSSSDSSSGSDAHDQDSDFAENAHHREVISGTPTPRTARASNNNGPSSQELSSPLVSTPRNKRTSPLYADHRSPEVRESEELLIKAADNIKELAHPNRFRALFSPSPSKSVVPINFEPLPTTKKAYRRWEEASGRVRVKVTAANDDLEMVERMENVAFSPSYVADKGQVLVANTAFSTLNLPAGKKVVFGANADEGGNWKLRICSVATGKVEVILSEKDSETSTYFEISQGGMFRVRAGEVCEIRAAKQVGSGDELEEVGETKATVFVVGVDKGKK